MDAYKFNEVWVRNMAPEEVRTYAPERGLSDKVLEAFQVELSEMYEEGYYNATDDNGDELAAECDWWYDKGRTEALDEVEEKAQEVNETDDYARGYMAGIVKGKDMVCQKVMEVL